MTEDTTAQAAEQTLAPSPPSAPEKPLYPAQVCPAALAMHTSLKSQYKDLSLEYIAEDLAKSIYMPGSRSNAMQRQVYVLDALFNELLITTPRTLESLPFLALALRAQRQCQITSVAIPDQKKLDERTDSSSRSYTDLSIQRHP